MYRDLDLEKLVTWKRTFCPGRAFATRKWNHKRYRAALVSGRIVSSYSFSVICFTTPKLPPSNDASNCDFAAARRRARVFVIREREVGKIRQTETPPRASNARLFFSDGRVPCERAGGVGTGRRAHLQDPSGVRGRLGRGVSLRRRGHRRVRVRLGHGARGRGRGERHDRRSPRTVRRTVSSAPSSRTGFRGRACRGRAAAPARPSGRLPGRSLACLPLDAARHPPEVATRADAMPRLSVKTHLAVSRSRSR